MERIQENLLGVAVALVVLGAVCFVVPTFLIGKNVLVLLTIVAAVALLARRKSKQRFGR
jgi:hypothetical protein